MPLKSDTVEAASRTLLLLEELNRHRVTSIDRLHKATGLAEIDGGAVDEVAMRDGLCRQRPAAGRLRGRLAGQIAEQRLSRRSAGGGGRAPVGARLHATISLADRHRRPRQEFCRGPLQHHSRQPGLAISRHPQHAPQPARAGAGARLSGLLPDERTVDAARHADTVAGGAKTNSPPSASGRWLCWPRSASKALPNATRWSSRARPARSQLPIIVNQRVLATVGMTYFTSALDRADVVQRYVPLVKALADNIAASVSSLQQ